MTGRTGEGESLTALILEVFRINGELLSAGNQLTKPMGLTSARWQVMGAIDLAGQPLTVAHIARRMGLARQGVQRIAHDLEKLGMVRFETNLDHKRSPLVCISEEGKEIMLRVDEAQAQWVNNLATGLNQEQIDQALQLLETIRTRSEEQT